MVIRKERDAQDTKGKLEMIVNRWIDGWLESLKWTKSRNRVGGPLVKLVIERRESIDEPLRSIRLILQRRERIDGSFGTLRVIIKRRKRIDGSFGTR